MLQKRNTSKKGVAQMRQECTADAQKVLRQCDSTNTSNTNTREYKQPSKNKPRKVGKLITELRANGVDI